MNHIEIDTSKLVKHGSIEATIEAVIAAQALHITRKDTLTAYPGCTHWHTKYGCERGVLEITWWPSAQRLWLTVHANRTAPWIEAAARQLKSALEQPVSLSS